MTFMMSTQYATIQPGETVKYNGVLQMGRSLLPNQKTRPEKQR